MEAASNEQQRNKSAYPGYVPDKSVENNNDNCNNKSDAADALADKGPVRNPNYHNLNDEKDLGLLTKQSDGKTLEDYNDINPKRDINTDNSTAETH